VVELIDVNLVQWREPLIWNIFGAEEVDIVCNIPISNYYQKDKMIWHVTSTGEFSVKINAYHIKKEHQGRKKGEGSNQARSQVVWKTTWDLKHLIRPKFFCGMLVTTFFQLRIILKEDVSLMKNYAFFAVKRGKRLTTFYGLIHRYKMCGAPVIVSFKNVGGSVMIL
jgi:hypothetical protein